MARYSVNHPQISTAKPDVILLPARAEWTVRFTDDCPTLSGDLRVGPYPLHRHHARAVEWFQRFRGQLLTTEAVVTETACVLAASPAHQRAALLWFERARAAGLLLVEPVADYAALARIIAQYASLPCDYADAALIALAEHTGVTAIATIDQRDFSVYRLRGRKRFRILP